MDIFRWEIVGRGKIVLAQTKNRKLWWWRRRCSSFLSPTTLSHVHAHTLTHTHTHTCAHTCAHTLAHPALHLVEVGAKFRKPPQKRKRWQKMEEEIIQDKKICRSVARFDEARATCKQSFTRAVSPDSVRIPSPSLIIEHFSCFLHSKAIANKCLLSTYWTLLLNRPVTTRLINKLFMSSRMLHHINGVNYFSLTKNRTQAPDI